MKRMACPRQPCNHCVEANYHPIPRNCPIATRAVAQQQRKDYTEATKIQIKRNNMANLNEMQQAIASLRAVVQTQQQAQQQQGNALQTALQAIQNNQNAFVSQPLPTFSGTVDEDVYDWLFVQQFNGN
ncbi:hypothetical protein OUZ56_003665 [Daphnia magna]|uniref:Uncharacterized protein n=1 Tax=Daphnia magna TaxID=35525 RepID=A0ABR0A9E3_9CRUS|nr:hypothetical protein OUZ56_003665 [Daphnia magna]